MFSFSTIKNYHENLLNGTTTCVEAVQFFLRSIEEQKHLNAFLETYADEALELAVLLDEKRKSGKQIGKLHGVVVGLKDVISFKGHKLSASSKILEGFTAVYNATVVEKLLAEEAIIIGRQNCDEFAMGSSNENSAFGNVLNVKDTSRVPGGSSGGSAVSVRAGLCMISLGSDTGGSVRQPADFCGIVGLKPSYGCVSRYGLIAYASSFDQIGILSKSTEDAVSVLEVISGKDGFDSTVSPEKFYSSLKSSSKKYKFCYFKQSIEHPSLDKEIADTFKNFIKKIIDDGHEAEAIDFNLLDYAVPAYYVLTTAEASSNLSRYDGVKFGYNEKNNGSINLADFYKRNRSKGFGDEVKRRILLGTFVLSEGYFDAYFTKAQQVRKLLANETKKIFSQYDCLLSPVSPGTAFKTGEKNTDPIEMFLADIYTVFANLTGIPAIALPLFTHTNGMDFGMQAMVSNNKEEVLLQISDVLTEIVQKKEPSATF